MADTFIVKPNVQITQNFNSDEFACKCCGVIQINMELVQKLERLRSELGQAIHVNSGFRCKKRNKAVGGAPLSQHCQGLAADIRCDGISPGIVASAAEKMNFPGVGRYPSFTHVDIRGGAKARWKEML
jgi:uncharacterized protein YcbK (DUF882 family)